MNDPASREVTAISSRLLSETINTILARKTALILDTCAAGAAIATLTGQHGVPSDQVRLLEELKDRTGFYVLAGCAAERQSYEASRYGQRSVKFRDSDPEFKASDADVVLRPIANIANGPFIKPVTGPPGAW